MLTRAEQSLPTEGLPTAGCAVMMMRAEQSLPTAGSNATKQDCVVLLHEMKFDHQDHAQACLFTQKLWYTNILGCTLF